MIYIFFRLITENIDIFQLVLRFLSCRFQDYLVDMIFDRLGLVIYLFMINFQNFIRLKFVFIKENLSLWSLRLFSSSYLLIWYFNQIFFPFFNIY